MIVVLAALAGAAGYFGEALLRPSAAPEGEMPVAEKKQELLFKMPLGKFTMQITEPQRIIHLVFDIDLYVMGAGAFQDINGAVGRAELRDATVTAIAEIAETKLGLADAVMDEAGKTRLAEEIVRELYPNWPMVRAARINSFIANPTDRS